MMRLVASIVLEVLANAVGLLAASWMLSPAFSIDAIGFITVVVIFSVVRFILAPLITQLSMRHARMLVGGVSLVTILASFFVTSLLTNHLAITGLSTWVLATLIVWVFGVIAMLLLPMVIFKKTLAGAGGNRPPSQPFS
jgi:putative membrane protein